jgi:surface polysaccharide O-acyltransferase-like enzyme
LEGKRHFDQFLIVFVMDRTFWVDWIRVVAAFLVIVAHVSGRVAGGYAVEGVSAAELGMAGLVSRCIGEASASVPVPLFVMISGALLLGRNESMSAFYRKRFGKILTPFCAWSFIFILCFWLAGRGLHDGTPITLVSSLGAFLSGNISGHFWYMYLLISLYIVAPFLSVFVRNASKHMLIAFVILWFIALAVFPVINNAAKETFGIAGIITGISDTHRLEIVSFWVGSFWGGFFIAGYVLKDVLISKRWALFAGIVWLCFAIAEPVSAYVRHTDPNSSVSYFLILMGKYVFPLVSCQVSLTLIAFFVLRSLGNLPSFASSRLGQMVVFTAPLTFGIYLCHHLILIPTMEILDKMLHLGTTDSWLLVLCIFPTLTTLFYLAAAGLVYVLRWSRYLKFLAP